MNLEGVFQKDWFLKLLTLILGRATRDEEETKEEHGGDGTLKI